MDDRETRATPELAIAVGAVSIGSALCIATFSVVGGPFGTINDLGNAAAGVLSAGLAWQLRGVLPGRSRTVGLGAAFVGSALAVTGSSLVVSGTTGWLLAGLVSSVGYAGIGAWLVLANREAPAAWPRQLRRLGVVAGALMITGLLALPGIALRQDDPASAPGWVWLGFLGWLGIYLVYPAWAISLGLGQRAAPLPAELKSAVTSD